MRILIDSLGTQEGGSITILQHLIPALLRQSRDYEYAILLSRSFQRGIVENLPKEVEVIDSGLSPSKLIRRWLYLQFHVPKLVFRGGFDLVFATSELGALQSVCPTLALIHNNILFSGVSEISWRDKLAVMHYRLFRVALARRMLQGADRLVFVSESFRQDVLRVTPFDIGRSCVIHHGVADFFRDTSSGPPLPVNLRNRPFILGVSTVAPHKNYRSLFEAFSLLVRRGMELDLAIVGGIRSHQYQHIMTEACKLGLADRVHFLGVIDHSLLPVLYRACQVFVFPSLVESFGLPLVEAMAAGAPVLASNLPVCREMCIDAAQYFDPLDPKHLAQLLEDVCNSHVLRNKLSVKGRNRATQFSWDRTAQLYLREFERCI